MIFNRHERCFGVVLWKWKQLFIQLWFCPCGYEIKAHSHPEEDIELMYLFGKTTFFRVDEHIGLQSFTPHWTHIFRTFTVAAGVVHWFTVSSLPLVFVNISRFKKGCKSKSAAVDFKLSS